ncbi:MAG: hypothetical protein PHS24_03705 [Bacilli bacterium]|nr:hypothetical protein [Bacilli bacterium]
MKNNNYKVSRKSIFVGELVMAYDIYRYKGLDNLFQTKPGELAISCWDSYRTMLFTFHSDMKSNDLLYKTKPYPVLNLSNDEMCLTLENESLVIQNACNLNLLLKYFNYKKELTYRDIINIRKIFFSGRFAQDNCELFGYKETKPEEKIYYRHGIPVVDPKLLKKYIKQERHLQEAGYRIFTPINENILPREYWDVLDDLGDIIYPDKLFNLEDKTDAFIPHKKEGQVKRLKRF